MELTSFYNLFETVNLPIICIFFGNLNRKMFTFCSRSLSRFLAALNAGGSCSSSRSTVINSSRVRALDGVSPNSRSLFLKVDSWTLTIWTTSPGVREKSWRRAAISNAVNNSDTNGHFPKKYITMSASHVGWFKI